MPKKPPRNSERSAKRPRGLGRRFPKGKSGNPKGRPPLPEDYRAAMKALDPLALKALEGVLDNPRHPRHEQAAEYVVNRNHGTPRTRTEVSTPPGKPIEVKLRGLRSMTTEERQRLAEELIARRAAALAGEGDGSGPDDDGGA